MKSTPAKATKAKPAAKKAAKAPATKSKPAKKPAKQSVPKSVAQKAAKKKPAAKPASKSTSSNPAPANTTALAKALVKVLDTNKAEAINLLNIRDKCSFADYMIVASGRAPRHVAALADYVADHLKKQGTPALSIEGKDSGDWVLIDAGDIVVHIFRPEVRSFYNIEKMWTISY